MRDMVNITGMLTSDDYAEMKRKLDENQSLDGKKVKLKYERYMAQLERGVLNTNFAEWLGENMFKTFTARLDPTDKVGLLYSLEGVDMWVFSLTDLQEVEEE